MRSLVPVSTLGLTKRSCIQQLQTNMLDTLITSKTRIKLLLKFFLNPNLKGYLRGLEQEFDEGSNSIRIELNRFEGAGLLRASTEGNRKYFQANQDHPMYDELNGLIQKYVGIDKILEWFVQQSGSLEAVYLTGKLAKGLNSNLIDLIVVGDNINRGFIDAMAQKAERLTSKKIRWVPYTKEKFEVDIKEFEDLLMIWKN